MRTVLLSLLVLCAMQVQASSKIYTWVDENGVVQFGDRPPLTANAQEIKMQGQATSNVVVTPALLQGNWRVSGPPGETQEWLVREDGRIQIDIKLGNDRRIIHGNWILNGSIMTLNADLVQNIVANTSDIDNEPRQFVYKFLSFEENSFRVFANGNNYLGQKAP